MSVPISGIREPWESDAECVVEIGSLPGRMSKAIMVRQGGVIWPVAYFRDEESFERFKAACQGRAQLCWIEDGEDDG